METAIPRDSSMSVRAIVAACVVCAAIHLHADQLSGVSISQKEHNSWLVETSRYSVKIASTPRLEMSVAIRTGEKETSVGVFPLAARLQSTQSLEEHSIPRLLRSGDLLEQGENSRKLVLHCSAGASGQYDVTLVFYQDTFSYQSSWSSSDIQAKSLEVAYFEGSPDAKNPTGQAIGEFDEVYTWTPDLYDALIPEEGSSKIGLSTHPVSGADSYLRGYSAGSPLVAPYVAALRTGSNWWGIGTIGIPTTSQGLELTVSKTSLGVSFGTTQLPEGKASTFDGPTIAFLFGKKPLDILSAYLNEIRDLTADSKIPAKDWHDWWAGPIYCTWGDEAYAARVQEGTLEEADGGHYITETNLAKWLGIARREKLPFKIVIIDLGWMLDYGDFVPNRAHFASLRKTIDDLHAEGIHVLLWIPMYEASGNLFSPDRKVSEVAQKHSDWLVRDKAGKTTDVFDFTNPEVRSYLKGRIHFLLSSDSNSLNADGLKVDFMDRVPDPSTTRLYDPSWGTGERMQAQVLELIYSSAKAAKSDALIDSSFMNPLFAKWQDIVRLNDDVSNSVDTYWWRAWAASVNNVGAIDGDDWWAMERYLVPLTLAKAAWGIPNIYALEYRGALGTQAQIGGVSSIASGGFPVNISQESYRQIRAILDVYLHSPATNTQKILVDPIIKRASREFTTGPLAGFHAALTLNHGYCLVTYDLSSAWLTSTTDESVSVPIPNGYRETAVVAVGMDGHESKVPFHHDVDGKVTFMTTSSGKGIDHYRIPYQREVRQ